MEVDFSKIDYDFVFTSPPYENLELYEGMAPWKSEADFYSWLIALIQKCRDSIVPSGAVCFNISIPMYVKLTQKYGYSQCHEKFPLCNKKSNRGKTQKEEFCYTWLPITKYLA
jgi:hypothetical protein